ncbi:MAG: ribosomal RNA small subunit methyltransferase I [Anaerolineaceae bacterium]|jgi:16S rRNA (cytidine1402-2'-O)-methyltransferase|nr:16S rRNA (cytidine(1402)-2'-O)-methyltransferase [Anaerolineae bacterium]MBL1171535.1 16S rRNA (cytidine(1402)-2'-O)-methyltransferase [Chloroflexota bacterium]MBV6467131.1 Ribosomal RNA small subunit methyltransferase I [Anaerolineales bacterium]MCE7906198.1 16S rRNA (cytidine(1402)-2'-O)-methyltransferase [Anaerolineae bacterium CFX3]MDL1925054.1 16S rRNA (cytidine(1402)-2'-O)-methyltransferase [Anaerolineae bacterium AMX1]OQY82824.1 MAG: 16S rRNA (cytidine(1402)-2'-O)-methyltransferase [
MGVLYLVATPIGNLEDMSPRAVRILREAKLIAAEDTRHTAKLLNHFGIRTPTTSYFEHNKLTKLDRVLAALADGDVALVSDAGTPAINDPGYELVRAALASGFDVRPVPGPSSPVAALSVSGLPTDAFLYLGYLPHKKSERRNLLAQIADLRYTLIFLESPHRLTASLEDLLAVLGDRPVCVAREMTKLYEEFWRGTLSGAADAFKAREARGEFTLVVGGQTAEDRGRWTEEELLAAIETELRRGKSAKEISVELAEQSGWNKKEVYALVNQNK